MSKIIRISNCLECPYSDGHINYWHRLVCEHPNRIDDMGIGKIIAPIVDIVGIPDFCPLEDDK